MPETTKPTFFKTAAAFHSWLEKNHDKKEELLVGFHKVDSGKPSITYKEALDEALCFGWIDGVRRSHDETSYTIRFTPRKPRSVWSGVNIRRAKQLIEEGRMQPPGLEAFNRREERRSEIYGYEQAAPAFEPAHEKQFRANPRAWEFFQRESPYYRKIATWYVISAKKDETRLKRLAHVIEYSGKGQRIPQMTPIKKVTTS